MEMFYNGLNAYTRMVVDTYANETSLDKSYNEAYEILEKIANNDYQYPTSRVGAGRRVVGTIELDVITSLTTQVSSLTNMIKTLKRPAVVWSNQGVGNSSNVVRHNVTCAPPGYNQSIQWQNVQQSSSSSLSMEAPLKEYMAKSNVVIQSQAAYLKALENQVGQIANALSSRSQGAFSSDTKNSTSQGKEHCKANTLRSGTELPRVVNDAVVEKDSSDFTHKMNSELVVEQSTIEKSKQKNVEVEPTRVGNKNAMAKQP
ncbi:Transposon Ty3-I Gag-Pol polyprotein [Gossypium australe]|uniref:Transposon Ty3-I Gag-Pol polyprotein n=1 Tax=Gossypium australe TaxID=47621 RepID=A0A5B6WY97_9ROSI|nr:Transposon Ty3-I Gag-Pol polyprotein [Gossypium australe]